MNIKKARDDLRRGKTIYDMSLRVVYYARVSTDKDDQLNSLENQRNYFEDMIKENPKWIFSGSYIDEGISGTAVKNRTSFLKMIEDSTNGKIDLILTKEISRFSRNTVDSIKYTEFLLKQGTIVYFLSDNLNTIQEDSEFRLTIMSSLAQDEIRKLSERVKFGINRMIKDRKLIGGNLTGYYKRDGKYIINEEETPIIRYLFETYVTGKVGLKKIGEDLAKLGYLNSKGKVYSQSSMAKFLTNARYKGFYTARLSEVEDYKTHKKRKIPKENQIIEKDDRIPAIVSEELWDKCNEIYNKRKRLRAKHILNEQEMLEKSKYSCKMYCKHCKSIFIRSSGGKRSNNPAWTCRTYRHDGISVCSSPIIIEKYLDNIFIELFASFINKKGKYFAIVIKEYQNIIAMDNESADTEKIKNQINQIEKQKDKLLDLSLKELIDDVEFKKRNDKFNLDINSLNEKFRKTECDTKNQKKFKEHIKYLKTCINKRTNIREELPNLMKIFVEKIEIEKINNDRKHVKIDVYLKFMNQFMSYELDMKRIKKELLNDKKVCS